MDMKTRNSKSVTGEMLDVWADHFSAAPHQLGKCHMGPVLDSPPVVTGHWLLATGKGKSLFVNRQDQRKMYEIFS